MGTSVAEKQFLIGASQQRTWELLGKMVYQCLPLEQMNLISLDTFQAVMRWRLGPVNIPLGIQGRLVDVVTPTSLGCLVLVSMGIIHLGVKVTFTLRPASGDRTEVVCRAMEEGAKTFWFLKGQERAFAENMFESIKTRLERLC